MPLPLSETLFWIGYVLFMALLLWLVFDERNQ
jgi:hypothetical protein